eukprot:4831303-Alexandrium_andersonii.AAC.1
MTDPQPDYVEKTTAMEHGPRIATYGSGQPPQLFPLHATLMPQARCTLPRRKKWKEGWKPHAQGGDRYLDSSVRAQP